MKLNLGCGSNKIPGYTNVDVEPSCEPDLVHDFTKAPLPFEDNSVEEILFFHTVEHISKKLHHAIFNEFWRVLKPGGTLIVSYPEFRVCVENWLKNEGDIKDFWEATIYGAQRYPSDYHVCIMDSHQFTHFLKCMSFINVIAKPEPGQSCNSFVHCQKGPKLANYEDIIQQGMEQYVIKGA